MTVSMVEFKIAPVRDVVRDLRHNIRWIVVIAGIWIGYVFASTLTKKSFHL
jgi:hypothetical protein